MAEDKAAAEENAILITDGPYPSDWNVWISLPGKDPLEDTYGFVVGCGGTRDELVADAVEALEAIVERLQAPRGAIEERKVRL